MSASLTGTSTLSYPALAANYGKLSTAPLEVMDVGSDGQQPLGSQGPNAYSGDRAMIDATPLPTPHATSTNEMKIPGLSINNVDQVTNPDLAPAHEHPQPELKSAQESQKQTGKITDSSTQFFLPWGFELTQTWSGSSCTSESSSDPQCSLHVRP